MVRSAAMTDMLELTDENVELVLDEIRPYLMAGLSSLPSCMQASCSLVRQWHSELLSDAHCACTLPGAADGGNVELVEIDGPVVYLRLQGACGSCPSSLTTMTMGIKRRLQERIPVRGACTRPPRPSRCCASTLRLRWLLYVLGQIVCWWRSRAACGKRRPVS